MTADDGGLRIWHQSFTVLDDVGGYRDALRDHFAKVARPGTTVDLHGMAPGTYPTDYPGTHIRYLHLQQLLREQFVRAAVTAEEQGYDAFFIATIPDVGFEEIRTLVDIPVVAYGQASLLVGATLGARVGVVNFIDDLQPQLRRNAEAYGLGGLLGPIVSIELPFGGILDGYRDAAPVVDAFSAAARRAIEEGAEVVVPGEGPLNILLARNGVSSVDDVPVVDSLAAGIKLCEVRVDLRRSGGLGPSRRGLYHARPPAELVAAAQTFAGEWRASGRS